VKKQEFLDPHSIIAYDGLCSVTTYGNNTAHNILEWWVLLFVLLGWGPAWSCRGWPTDNPTVILPKNNSSHKILHYPHENCLHCPTNHHLGSLQKDLCCFFLYCSTPPGVWIASSMYRIKYTTSFLLLCQYNPMGQKWILREEKFLRTFLLGGPDLFQKFKGPRGLNCTEALCIPATKGEAYYMCLYLPHDPWATWTKIICSHADWLVLVNKSWRFAGLIKEYLWKKSYFVL
jgi:hypothetical protein